MKVHTHDDVTCLVARRPGSWALVIFFKIPMYVKTKIVFAKTIILKIQNYNTWADVKILNVYSIIVNTFPSFEIILETLT